MTEIEFDMLIKRAIEEHIDEYIPESEIDKTPHKFSKEFEREMNKLINNKGKIKLYAPKRLLTYITVAIIAAIIFTLSISAFREALINFITNIFNTHTEVQSISDESVPTDIIDIYEITRDISDYELVSVSEDVFLREYIYQNEHSTIIYSQNLKSYYNTVENTEGYSLEVININGHEGYYIDMVEGNAIRMVWDNGDYIIAFTVVYDDMYIIDKKFLLDMANSVQKVE